MIKVISRLYIENVIGTSCEEQSIVESSIKDGVEFKKISEIYPNQHLKILFDEYRSSYDDYSSADFVRLNQEILNHGFKLSSEMLLFHGRGNPIKITDRPISTSILPSKAIWHARKHRDHLPNGNPIYIYVLRIAKDCDVLGCIDFNDLEFGHENEVLLQSGLDFYSQLTVEIYKNVFVQVCDVKNVY